jgi:apolipoprotein N-acyltransferase
MAPLPHAAPPKRSGALLLRCAAAFVGGLLAPHALAPTDAAWLAFVASVPFWVALDGAAGFGSAVLIGLCYGYPSFWFSLQFLGKLGPLPLGALALYQALFVVGIAVLYRLLSRPLQPRWRPILAASAWVLADWARENAGGLALKFTNIGLALDRAPVMIQCADLGGLHLVTWLIALACAALALAAVEAVRRNWRAASRILALPAALWALNLGYGVLRLAPPEDGPALRVAIAQPAKLMPAFYSDSIRSLGLPAEVRLYRELLDGAGVDRADLVMLPESGLSADLVSSDWLRSQASGLARPYGAWLATGCHHLQGKQEYNGVALVDPRGELRGTYDKRHLVAFGEYLPFRQQLAWLYKSYPIRPFDVTPGTSLEPFVAGDARLAPVVCFESMFGGEVRRSARAGVNAIAIFTNDGWFDSAQEARQHAREAVFRAIEHRLPVLRAASTGYSGLIDSRGRWVAMAGRDESKALLVEAKLRQPRSLYHLLGSAAVVAPCFAILVAPPIVRRVRERARDRDR